QPRRRGRPAATASTGLLINPAESGFSDSLSRTGRHAVWTTSRHATHEHPDKGARKGAALS
ncbi:MAG: hypothetical protein ACLP8S_29965, partial [Solirubrobacteraceae bacterium]